MAFREIITLNISNTIYSTVTRIVEQCAGIKGVGIIWATRDPIPWVGWVSP